MVKVRATGSGATFARNRAAAKMPDNSIAASPANNSTAAVDNQFSPTGVITNELVCPISGEIVALNDVDGLLDIYERIDRLDRRLYETKQRIRDQLGAMTEGDAKTRRIAGKRRAAKLEFPSDSWDNSILRECYESYPQYRDQYLRIAKIDPKLVEVKKLLNTTGTPDLNSFRDMIGKANRGPSGAPPTLKIEK